jgi:hypothetical protein
MESTLTKNQTKVYPWKVYTEDGETYRIRAVVRYDDRCGNGHNSFSITGEIQRKGDNGAWYAEAYGCLHEDIARRFPALAPLLKWHLCNADGPMHYIANSLFLAGDRDCWGGRKGEVKSWDYAIRFDGFPALQMRGQERFLQKIEELDDLAALEVVAVEHPDNPGQFSPHYTFFEGEKWHQCPFKMQDEAAQMLEAFQTLGWEVVKTPASYHEGREPELDAARRAAIWPDAELEDFTRENLEARLPGLLEDFRRDVESLGFTW